MRFLHSQVTEAGFRAAMLHGERSQEEREAAMADFRSGKAQVRAYTACWELGIEQSCIAFLSFQVCVWPATLS